MSCKMISIDELARITPVTPPIENKKINPIDQSIGISNLIFEPKIVANQEKILIPVGTAIIIVAEVKYARESISNPTVNIWWAQTINPKIPILIIAYNIPKCPNTCFFPLWKIIVWEIIPNPGKIRIYTSGWPKNQKRCW